MRSSSPATKDQAWITWAAHNLAMGIEDQSILKEMIEGGLGRDKATSIVQQIRASPVFGAIQKLGNELRKWHSLADALTDLSSLTRTDNRIPRISNISSGTFLSDYYATNQPVIIEGFISDWPAISKWSPAYLKSKFGTLPIQFQSGRSSTDHRDSFVDHATTSTFSEFIELIEDSEPSNAHYLIAHDKLLDRPEFQSLLDDMIFDDSFFSDPSGKGRIFFWMGSAGCMTPMHRDLGNVFFAQIRGEKLVKLIPSMLMHRVYNETGYHSEVDFDQYSTNDFPLLKEIPIAEEVIRPGELLFIPLGWWHFVKSLSLSITVTGNNFKFKNSFADIF